jgi:hypothetical protein
MTGWWVASLSLAVSTIQLRKPRVSESAVSRERLFVRYDASVIRQLKDAGLISLDACRPAPDGALQRRTMKASAGRTTVPMMNQR